MQKDSKLTREVQTTRRGDAASPTVIHVFAAIGTATVFVMGIGGLMLFARAAFHDTACRSCPAPADASVPGGLRPAYEENAFYASAPLACDGMADACDGPAVPAPPMLFGHDAEVTLLVDVSGSMSEELELLRREPRCIDWRPREDAPIQHTLSTFPPGSDRLPPRRSVYSNWREGFAEELAALEPVADPRPYENAYDALVVAAFLADREAIAPRRVFVVVTDERPESSWGHMEADVCSLLRPSDTLVVLTERRWYADWDRCASYLLPLDRRGIRKLAKAIF
jgi:hypothetical protein